MLRLLISFFIMIVFISCVTDSKYKVKRPFLYEAKKMDQSIYLFGTIHTAVSSEDLPKWFWRYFGRSEIFIHEMAKNSQVLLNKKLQNRIYRNQYDRPLKEEFSATELEEVRLYLKRHHPQECECIIDKYSLFGVYYLFYSTLPENKIQVKRGEFIRLSSIKFQMDEELKEKAYKENKKSITLDEWNEEEIARCLSENPGKFRNDILRIVRGELTEKVNPVPEILEMAIDYRQGNDSSLQNNLQFEGEDCLLTKRNKNWLPRILEAAKSKKTTFVAVGAGHLIQSQGSLLQLLKDQGFTVQRIESETQ